MADFRGKPLPNLKISVDNTESTDESESEGEIQEEIKVPIVVIEDKEESEVEEDSDKDEVEFNVRIGSYARDRNKDQGSGSETEDRHGERDERSSYKTKSTDTEKEKIKRPVQESALPPQKRVYENKSGTFVTGIDVTSEEAAEKRKKRAERFRIQQEEAAQQTLDLEGLYKSLGISESEFENEEKGLRKEAVRMWGTDNMSTKDVFDYFAEFPPSAIEWINDTSCNVVWLDKVTAVRAMLKHSISYDDAMAAEAKRIQAEKEHKHQHKKAQDQEMKDMEKEDKTAEPGGDGDSEEKSKETSDTKAGKDAAADAPEKMDVDEDDDNLDLTVDSNTEDVAMKKKTEGGGKAKENEDSETGKTGEKTKKKHEKKKSKKGKDDGNDSDNSTSSSSSSGSSSSGSGSGSASSSSSGSGSASDSGSGSGSSSSSGSGSSSSSSSDSEGGKDSKSNKKASKKSLSRRDGETGELSPHERRRTKRKKNQTIPWPSGKWRLGTSCQKARYLFMRFATADDKKEPGAEKKSQYYRRYGNPNYGGMKGLISQSRKRKIRMAKIDKEIKSQGPDARELIDTKRANRKRAREEEDREEGEISEDDSGEEEEEESGVVVVEDDEDDVMVVNAPKMAEKPKDLRHLLDRETAQPARLTRSDSHESDDRPVVVKALGEKEDEGEEDEMDFDAELAYLMKNPPKKRMMRMHADDEEEKLKAKKRKGLLTVIAKDGAGVRSRLGGRLQQTRQDGRIYDVEDDEDDEDIFGNERDYGDFVVRRDEDQGGQSSGGGDLRSKLSARKRTGGSDRRHYPPMRIEVFD